MPTPDHHLTRCGRLLAAVVGLVWIVTPPATAQDAVGPARELHEKVAALSALRAQRHDAMQTHGQQTQSLREQIDALESQLAEARRSLVQQRPLLEAMRQDVARHETVIATVEPWLTAAAAAVAPVAQQFVSRIEAGIPFDRRARLAPFAQSADRLAAEPDPAAVADAIRVTFQTAGDELLAAQQVELINTPIDLDAGDRREHAWRLRLGLAHMLFVAEDASLHGLWSGDPAAPWRTDLDPAHVRELRQALDVARERTPPRLIAVPITLEPEN